MHHDGDRRRVIFPGQRQRALAAAVILKRVLQVLHHRRRLAHVHLYFAEVLRSIVGQAPLARLLADNEGPLVRIADVDEQSVVTFGNGKVADHNVTVSVESGGRVRAGTPHRIVRVMADQAVFRKDLALAAFDSGRGVGDGHLVTTDVGRCLGRWAGRRLLLSKHACSSE